MTKIDETLRVINSLIAQITKTEEQIQTETDNNTRLHLETFQAVLVLNIHMLNMNLALMDALGMYDTKPELKDTEAEAEALRLKQIQERNAKFLNNQNRTDNNE